MIARPYGLFAVLVLCMAASPTPGAAQIRHGELSPTPDQLIQVEIVKRPSLPQKWYEDKEILRIVIPSLVAFFGFTLGVLIKFGIDLWLDNIRRAKGYHSVATIIAVELTNLQFVTVTSYDYLCDILRKANLRWDKINFDAVINSSRVKPSSIYQENLKEVHLLDWDASKVALIESRIEQLSNNMDHAVQTYIEAKDYERGLSQLTRSTFRLHEELQIVVRALCTMTQRPVPTFLPPKNPPPADEDRLPIHPLLLENE